MAEKGPTQLMRKAAARLFPDDEGSCDAFLRSLVEPEPLGSAVIWTRGEPDGSLATVPRSTLPDWLPSWVELTEAGERPGRSAAHDAGEIYPLDYSSIWTGSALLPLAELDPPRILDLCAAPGGKSIFAARLLQPSFLLANEVVKKRLGMLRHNLGRCGVRNAATQALTPQRIAEIATGAFTVTLVDAPCSGQSLLAKGQDNPGCFHPSIVKGNARRQTAILRWAAATVAPGGYLFYSTCTFSDRENEGVLDRFLKQHEDFDTIALPHLEGHRSPLTKADGYRFHPLSHCGAGGFVALLQREGTLPDPLPSLPDELVQYPVSSSASSGSPTETGAP